jgi:hypothetical protein
MLYPAFIHVLLRALVPSLAVASRLSFCWFKIAVRNIQLLSQRISTAYTDTAQVTNTGARQPTHTPRTRGTQYNTLLTPSAAPYAHLLC